jgi:hypothetical protein
MHYDDSIEIPNRASRALALGALTLSAITLSLGLGACTADATEHATDERVASTEEGWDSQGELALDLEHAIDLRSQS